MNQKNLHLKLNLKHVPIETFNEIMNWALHEPQGFKMNMPKKERELRAKQEAIWGNQMLRIINNTPHARHKVNWSTKVSEWLVQQILIASGYHPQRTTYKSHDKKHTYKPDWTTQHHIYEVKARTWFTSGTAGEKVLGAPTKYRDVPHSSNKPLHIICMAFQEYELTHGPTPIFHPDIHTLSPTLHTIIHFYQSTLNIHFTTFTEFVHTHLPQIL